MCTHARPQRYIFKRSERFQYGEKYVQCSLRSMDFIQPNLDYPKLLSSTRNRSTGTYARFLFVCKHLFQIPMFIFGENIKKCEKYFAYAEKKRANEPESKRCNIRLA